MNLAPVTSSYSFPNFGSSREPSQLQSQFASPYIEPQCSTALPHPASLVRAVATPSATILVVAGGEFISAIAIAGGARSPSFAHEVAGDTLDGSIRAPGHVVSMSVHSLPGTDGAIGVVGTISGHAVVFTVSCAGTGRIPLLRPLGEYCIAAHCSGFAHGGAITAVTIGFNRLLQYEYFAVATDSAVALLSLDVAPRVLLSFTVHDGQVVSLLAPLPAVIGSEAAGIRSGGLERDGALFAVLDSQAVLPVARVPSSFDPSSLACTFVLRAPLLIPSGECANYVNDADFSFQHGPSTDDGEQPARVLMCGLGWWGIAAVDASTGGRMRLQSSAPSTQRLSLCRGLGHDAAVFAGGCDVLVATAVGERQGVSRQLRPVFSFGSVVSDLCAVPMASVAAAGDAATKIAAVNSAAAGTPLGMLSAKGSPAGSAGLVFATGVGHCLYLFALP